MPAATISDSSSDASSVFSRERASRAAAPSAELCGTTAMNRRGPSAASAFRRSTSSGAATVRFATTSVTSNGRPSFVRSTTTCSTGSPGLAPQAADQIRLEPGGLTLRQRGHDDLVDLMLGDGVLRGVERVGVADLARARDALVAHELEREVDPHLGGVAHDVVIDHVPVARPLLRHDHVEVHVPAGRALAHAIEQVLAADRLVRQDQDVRHP